MLVGVTWAFGGNAEWVRTPISLWGSIGVALTLALAAARPPLAAGVRRVLSWIWPVLALNALVLASCATAGFRAVSAGADTLLVPVRIDWWVPSSAGAAASLRALWLFDGVYFTCANIALAVGRRRTLRLLLGVAFANSVALSVFGTVQKLAGSTGIYFNAVRAPHPFFFASFVYDNHWGAYCVLALGAGLGLTLRYSGNPQSRGLLQGPVMAGLVSLLLVGLTVPLSGSRACTLLMAALAACGLAKGSRIVSRSLRLYGLPPAASILCMAAAFVLALASIWYIAGGVIEARMHKTKEQAAEMWARGGIGSRSALYHDTWRMARERPLFGWGMGSYPRVFPLFNTQESKIDRLPVIYHDAHSDWLQSLAELGLAGTLLLGAAVALPLWPLRRSMVMPVPFFLLAGCALVAAYALVEFPFGNVAVALHWWFSLFVAVHYARLPDPVRPAGPR
jgi:O-antigen ligase